MSLTAPVRMTAEEFFAWQDRQAERYELVAGVPTKMMGGVKAGHDRVVVNTIVALAGTLRNGPCRPFTGEFAVRTKMDQVRRPDVGVDYGTTGNSDLEASDPRVVVEVLSPATRRTDQFTKLREYQSVDTVTDILLIEPDFVGLQHWQRDRSGTWALDAVDDVDAVIELVSIGASVALRDLYDGVIPSDTPLSLDTSERPA